MCLKQSEVLIYLSSSSPAPSCAFLRCFKALLHVYSITTITITASILIHHSSQPLHPSIWTQAKMLRIWFLVTFRCIYHVGPSHWLPLWIFQPSPSHVWHRCSALGNLGPECRGRGSNLLADIGCRARKRTKYRSKYRECAWILALRGLDSIFGYCLWS